MSAILLIDDDPAVRQVMSDMLRLEGHDVTLAENGKVAAECVKAARFDLVITDLIMPEKKGSRLLPNFAATSLKFPSLRSPAAAAWDRTITWRLHVSSALTPRWLSRLRVPS